MADTYLDQLVEFPAEIIRRISEDKYCVGLLVNKSFDSVEEDDMDDALENHIFDYQYVDKTTQEAGAYVWAEIEVPRVDNRQIKSVRVYVTIACHGQVMRLDRNKFAGVIGNRRDNLVRYVDRLLNGSQVFGIGTLELRSALTLTSINNFTIRELTYEIPDFNIVELNQ